MTLARIKKFPCQGSFLRPRCPGEWKAELHTGNLSSQSRSKHHLPCPVTLDGSFHLAAFVYPCIPLHCPAFPSSHYLHQPNCFIKKRTQGSLSSLERPHKCRALLASLLLNINNGISIVYYKPEKKRLQEPWVEMAKSVIRPLRATDPSRPLSKMRKTNADRVLLAPLLHQCGSSRLCTNHALPRLQHSWLLHSPHPSVYLGPSQGVPHLTSPTCSFPASPSSLSSSHLVGDRYLLGSSHRPGSVLSRRVGAGKYKPHCRTLPPETAESRK